MKKYSIIGLIILLSVTSFLQVSASTYEGTIDDQTGDPTVETGIDGVLASVPVFSPEAGTYNEDQSVEITAASSTAICYTTDGEAPTCSGATICGTGTKYTEAIEIASTTTLRARACYADGTPGPASDDQVYTLACAIASVANGTVADYPSCAITCNSGYSLSGNTCVVAGGGGGGGGAVSIPSIPTTTTGQVTATSISGGQTTLTTSNLTQVKVEVPAGAVSSNTVITIEETEVGTIMIGAPSPSGQTPIITFSLTATVNGQPVTQFSGNVTVTITYTDDQIAGLDESSLKIYHWDGTQWVALSTTVNLSTNTLTATTTSFSDFAVMGQEGEASAAPIEPSKPVNEMTATELIAEINRLSIILAQLQQQIALLNQAQESGVIPASCQGIVFSRSLSQQMTGEDVKCLQAILNQSSDTQVASSGVGSLGRETNYFGNLTRSAVIKFQEKYRSEILTPLGLSSGTGYVGNSTIAKLNQLLGQ